MIEKDELFAQAEQLTEKYTSEILEISHKIFNNPELAYKEFSAADLLQVTVERRGFTVQRGQGLLQTAVRGEHELKAGNLNIGFISEFDALPNGHACGGGRRHQKRRRR